MMISHSLGFIDMICSSFFFAFALDLLITKIHETKALRDLFLYMFILLYQEKIEKAST